MGKVIWTYKSRIHLKSIHEYISKDSVYYADRFINGLIFSTERLKLFPEIGIPVPELVGFEILIREIFYKSYRIVYKINSESNIEILGVIHNKRDFGNLIEGELGL